MSFKLDFERGVNKMLQREDQHRPIDGPEAEEPNLKKRYDAASPVHEEEDCELAAKKDTPPRFSTLFTAAPAPVIVERDPPREKKRSGVFIPMPIFILLAALFFFMSTLLFVYTIIGLYNNRPAGLVNFGGPSPAPIDACDCADKHAGINIAPNFVMGPSGKTETVTVTLTPSAAVAADAKTSSSSSTTTKSSTKKTPSTTSTKIVKVTPPPHIATSTAVIAVGPDGKPLPTSTIHSTKTVAATTSKNKADKKEASINSALESAKSKLGITVSTSLLNPETTLQKPSPTTKTKKTDKDKSTKTSKKKDSEPTPCDPDSLTNSCQH